MPRQLPPLNALRVFEITARAGSYTEAAKELHLTHGAISKQIQLLEQALGQPLFYKVGQRMVATSHAKEFAREIGAAFENISDASRRYGKNPNSKVIRISAPATFAMRWLVPKLEEFRASHPRIELRISTVRSDDPPPPESIAILDLDEPWALRHHRVCLKKGAMASNTQLRNLVEILCDKSADALSASHPGTGRSPRRTRAGPA